MLTLLSGVFAALSVLSALIIYVVAGKVYFTVSELESRVQSLQGKVHNAKGVDKQRIRSVVQDMDLGDPSDKEESGMMEQMMPMMMMQMMGGGGMQQEMPTTEGEAVEDRNTLDREDVNGSSDFLMGNGGEPDASEVS
jgi:hypothetical protein